MLSARLFLLTFDSELVTHRFAAGDFLLLSNVALGCVLSQRLDDVAVIDGDRLGSRDHFIGEGRIMCQSDRVWLLTALGMILHLEMVVVRVLVLTR